MKDPLAHLQSERVSTPQEHAAAYDKLKRFLMKPQKPKRGDPTSLNVSLLKELYDYVLFELTPREKASISPFELQSYLIETAVKRKEDLLSTKFDKLLENIMSEVRACSKFWIGRAESEPTNGDPEARNQTANSILYSREAVDAYLADLRELKIP